ncbi:SDR family NAD(P)-dependent oxidoreductase [Cupriavidus oxalaticus]|uniref:SDR family NAD(P)-dependent oxidoreductase n=1 Tax=Cupriavidus oxalaticus TaxID=96344 RepID=A0A375G9W2_9BURK|nr:SDR family NAD(P)-dependent oxidoreductase [Cupriavidus oxalaticus]QRQ86772.1 SDR family NAD(P)-dependent oxidoreductase [Cupriavidus oxalaticus]QRQ94900.1 SDR family NAD(P)-dependent oxidoreductase [Cupriavidus oxalaticus]WQD83553.1 SDR family NAD(P)-dependent oxidoreductase [Cupriavidus oxalaticus]SPC16802.1 hypothetical protein CO2235_60019 [Cupriavidus oxalaticus]
MNAPTISLHGKTAWITGGSSGIGRACALSLWQAGATVVISARSEAAIACMVAGMVADCGNERVIALPLDVSDREGGIKHYRHSRASCPGRAVRRAASHIGRLSGKTPIKPLS